MAIIFLGLLMCVSAYVTAEPVSTGYWGATAIGGTDTVAYHSQRQVKGAVAGDKRFSVTWQGARWLFASQASAEKFAAAPERYRPEYNGFCSNALSMDEGLIATDGRVWEFFGDKLHLFYAERGRKRWLDGPWPMYQQQADSAWALLRK